MRRARPLLIALLLAGALSAQEAKRDKALHVIPVEEFLPRATLAFVSVPDGRTALGILERAGEDRKALAARLAERAGVAPGPLATLLEILAATADGPVTFSLHREAVRGRGVTTQMLVTAATRRPGRALEDTGKNLVRSLLVPLFAKEVNGNRLMGVPVVRLRGEETELYQTTTRGYLMLSTSSLLLGRVLKEMQSPTGNTLKYTPDWVAASLRAKREKGEGALLVTDPSVLPWLETLGATSVAGRLARDGDGFRDEVFLMTGKGPLARLGVKGGVPAALSKSGRGRVWIGAALTPRGVLSLLFGAFDKAHAPLMIPVGDVAAGGVEVLLAPSRPPLFRIPLREGADAAGALAHLGRLARVSGNELLLSRDAEALAAAVSGKGETWAGGGAAGLKASVPSLLKLLGRDGAPGGRATTWSAHFEKDAVRVTSGRAELGPFQAIVASLIR